MGIAIAALIIGGTWLGFRYFAGRRSSDTTREDGSWAMASWLPAGFIRGGGVGHDAGRDADASGPFDGGALGGADFGAGDFGGPTDFGGGGDAGGGFGG